MVRAAGPAPPAPLAAVRDDDEEGYSDRRVAWLVLTDLTVALGARDARGVNVEGELVVRSAPTCARQRGLGLAWAADPAAASRAVTHAADLAARRVIVAQAVGRQLDVVAGALGRASDRRASRWGQA